MHAFLLCLGLAAAGNTRLNPITRVAQLLEGLSKKVENDGKAEQDIYDQYKCWCTKVMNAKSASMEANGLRINELSAYIDDLSNGRVELTSERTTLEDEIKELEKAIAEEENMREKEHEDYEAAKDEMDKAIAALTSATQKLSDATAAHQEGVLSSIKTQLKKAMNLGEGFLAKRDVTALLRALDVPERDEKKLQRDATFKKKYKARSGNIQEILADMLQTFTDNREEAVAAEKKAASDFGLLMKSKKEQLTAAKQAMLDKAGENGARAASKAESEAEKSDLESQNERDQVFYDDTKTACAEKATQWEERKRLRSEEVQSISQAISILRSDDARDLFKKSFDSQSFLQVSRKHNSRRSRALAMIRQTAVASKDVRLASLAATLTTLRDSDPFAAVLASIDKMNTDLLTEEADDMAKKEQCEKDRMDNSQEAKVLAKKIDTNTETIDRLASQVAAANKQIEEINAEVAELNKQKKEATEQRSNAAAEYTSAKKDDQGAVALVGQAIGVLQDFYTRNNLGLVQARKEPFVAAGEAPTPPPATWDEGYGGAKGESNGIVGLMETIKADIEKDIAKADADELESIKEFNTLCSDIDKNIASLGSTKGDLEGAIADDEDSSTREKGTRSTNQGDLDSTLEYLKQIAPGCDFMAVNFDDRKTNRQAEMDGLAKAKAVLNGADFGL